MNKKKVGSWVTAAMFCAMILVMTLLRIPVLSGGGYIHAGDAVIYLAASFLPSYLAALAAAAGGAMADIFCGAAVWAPATFVIKFLLPWLFTSKKDTVLCRRNVIALGLALAVTAAGYYLAEAVLFGDMTVPLLSLPGNLLQSVAAAVLYLCAGASLDRLGAKKHLM